MISETSKGDEIVNLLIRLMKVKILKYMINV